MAFVGRGLAGTLAITYVGVVLRAGLARLVGSGDASLLMHSLMQPWTLLAVVVGLLCAIGLWARYAWAWWLALVAGGVQLVRVGAALLRWFQGGATPSVWTVLVVLLLVALLATLLATTTRRQCTR